EGAWGRLGTGRSPSCAPRNRANFGFAALETLLDDDARQRIAGKPAPPAGAAADAHARAALGAGIGLEACDQMPEAGKVLTPAGHDGADFCAVFRAILVRELGDGGGENRFAGPREPG